MINRGRRGVALMAFVLAILGLALTAGVIAITGKWLADQQAITVTQQRLLLIATAISNTNITPTAQAPRHFEQDVGSLPTSLNDLFNQGGYAACALNGNALAGWCGPYLINTYSGENLMLDGWGTAFKYNSGGRNVYSFGPNRTDDSGGGDDLLQNF